MISVDLAVTKKWLQKFGTSMTDQFVFAGSNFLLNLLLARWLIPDNYGAFSVAYSIFIMATGLHNAFILEPLALYGPTKYQGQLRRYLRILLILHFGTTIIISGFILAGVRVLVPTSSVVLRHTLDVAAISMPLILLIWLARRFFYMQVKPHLACMTSIVYGLLLLSCIALFYSRNLLDSSGGFWVLGSAGLVSFLFALFLLRPNDSPVNFIKDSNPSLREVAALHWGYGKWFINSAALYWLTDVFYTPLLGTLSGLSAAGAYQAIRTLLQPIQQVRTAVSTLLVPWFTASLAQDDKKTRIHQLGWTLTLASTILSAVYGLILYVVRNPLLELVYQNEYYISFSWLVSIIVLGSIVRSVVIGPSIVFKALGLSKYIFMAQATSVAVTISVGIPLVSAYGITGAAWGSVLSNIALSAGYYYFFLTKAQAQ